MDAPAPNRSSSSSAASGARAPSTTGNRAPASRLHDPASAHISTSVRAFRVASSRRTLPKTVVRPRTSTSVDIVSSASAMAKASSTPGSVSMMSLRGGGDAGVERETPSASRRLDGRVSVCRRGRRHPRRGGVDARVDECRRAYGEDS